MNTDKEVYVETGELVRDDIVHPHSIIDCPHGVYSLLDSAGNKIRCIGCGTVFKMAKYSEYIKEVNKPLTDEELKYLFDQK